MKVVIDGTDVEVKIIRKSNKNIYIRVKSDLCIYVTTNYFVSDKYVSNLINNNIDFVTKMYRKECKKRDKASKFYYLGKEYNVVITNLVKHCVLDLDYAYVSKESDLDKFLDKMSKEVLTNRVRIVFDRINLHINYPVVNIRKMVRKWGYCNKSKGLITLNKELIKYDIDDIDYVIVHELVHFVHFDHSKEFWKLVKELKPDYLVNKKHLNEE